MDECVFLREKQDLFYEEGATDSSEQWSPLGLTLRKTPSFLSLVQRTLSLQDNLSPHHDDPETERDDSERPLSISDKLKASNFPALFIRIGAWQRRTMHDGDLTAKVYYAKHKLVWEVLDGALKSKIEIQWSDIIAIRAITPDNEPGTLEIELNRPPLFYREINPQPRKHTLWQQASDFTGGQAPTWRRHYVRFPTRILDNHYEKLLQCDRRLFALSQKPFPSYESPYFDPTMFRILRPSLNGYGSSAYLPDGMRYPHHTYPSTSTRAPITITTNSTFRDANDDITWGRGLLAPINTNEAPFNITPATPGNQDCIYQNYRPNIEQSNDIDNHLLGGSEVGSSDEGILSTRVEPMFEPSNFDVDYNANCSGDKAAAVNSEALNWLLNSRQYHGIEHTVSGSGYLPPPFS